MMNRDALTSHVCNVVPLCARSLWTLRGSSSSACTFRWRTSTSTLASSPWGRSGTTPPSRSRWRTWTSRRCSNAQATSWRSKRTPPGTRSSARSAPQISTRSTVQSGKKCMPHFLSGCEFIRTVVKRRVNQPIRNEYFLRYS